MVNSKLFSILSKLDSYELNRCEKYVLSPYFNKNEGLIRLFSYLMDRLKKSDDISISKQELWEVTEPEKPYDDTRLRKYISDLIKLVEGFLIQEQFESDHLKKANYLIEAVEKKKIEKLYSSSTKNAKRQIDHSPFQSAWYYFQRYEFEQHYYDLTQFVIKRTHKSNVDEIISNLDYFYLAEKLRLFCTIKSQEYVVAHSYDSLFMDEVLRIVQRLPMEDIPPLAIYYRMYLTQNESENEKHYYYLKELIDQHIDKFPSKEAYFIYSEAMNYCIRRTNAGDFKFLSELFTLYKDQLKNELIFSDGKLSPWRFKNITNCALRLKEFEWTEWFINAYEDKLPDAFRSNAVTFNLAQLYYYQHRYEEVIEKLKDVEFDDFSYNLTSKTMLIATYYELDEIEPLFFLLESFRTYLNRHKEIPTQRRQYYLNAIRVVKRLSRVIPGDEKAITKVKTDFETKKSSIAMEAWIEEKIAELEGA